MGLYWYAYEVKHHLMQVTQTLIITINLIGINIINSTLNTGLFSDNLRYILVVNIYILVVNIYFKCNPNIL